MPDIKYILGKNIQSARRDHHLTQVQLAVRADISLTVLSAAEQGRQNLTVDTVARIAQALETSLPALLEEKRG